MDVCFGLLMIWILADPRKNGQVEGKATNEGK